MLVIFGFRNRWKELAQGTFFCPSCGGDRYYAHRQQRRWFTLFFLPIVPTSVVGETYQCQTCHRTFDEWVLDTPTTSDLATRLQWAMRLAVVQIVLDGNPHEAPVRLAAVAAVKSTGSIAYSDTQLDGDLRAIDLTQLDQALGQLTMDFEPVGKETFLRSCGDVALATGLITPTNRATLEAIGRGLGLTPAHVHGVLSQIHERHTNHG